MINWGIENIVVKDKTNDNVYLDTFSKLLEKGIVTCYGPITDDLALFITAHLTWLSNSDIDKPIQLWIQSPGGSVEAGLQIIDMMQWIKEPITTIVQGYAASMGAMIAMCGDNRSAFPHARLMIHELSYGVQGKTKDVAVSIAEANKMSEELMKIISKKTKLGTVEEIKELVKLDRWYSAQEALNVGMIDEIVEINKNK